MHGRSASDPPSRAAVLEAHGASPDVIEELRPYLDHPFARAQPDPVPAFPLPDEPHLQRWILYAAEAERDGAFVALQRRFVQLRFPIRAGISREEAYRRATLRGLFAEADAFAPGLVLHRPEGLTLSIHTTVAGRVPVLVVEDRSDFVALVRAFSERNEPVPVPEAMGACIVTGLNNWDRIAAYRQAWAAAQSGPVDDGAWAEEFRRLAARKPLYQDRFVVLSTGPYSGLPAATTGFPEADWLARSLVIRREHEFTHYFTYRVFGVMRNHLLDELVADFVGLLRGVGEYRPALARACLGLDDVGRYREGGRLACYRGEPPLSDGALAVVGRLAVSATANLAAFAEAAGQALFDLGRLAAAVFTLVGFTLEELAAEDLRDRALARWRTLARGVGDTPAGGPGHTPA
jgi:hypothetical protein